VIEDYNKGITNPNGVFSGIARHNIKGADCSSFFILGCLAYSFTWQQRTHLKSSVLQHEIFVSIHVVKRSSLACFCGRNPWSWPGPSRIRDLQACSPYSIDGRGPIFCHLLRLWNQSLDGPISKFPRWSRIHLNFLYDLYLFSGCLTTHLHQRRICSFGSYGDCK
jgi:hypothetical protein